MFEEYSEIQYELYHKALQYYTVQYNKIIEVEKFVMNEILHFIDLHKPEIVKDYNEASYLYSFWKNYPPEDRGRQPIHDQYPWIEVGEQVFGNKLSRYFNANFLVRDAGLPSGADDRCIISSPRIKEILGITDSVWVFIDIKSAGPRDDFEHAVMSPYQISGSGEWATVDSGVVNAPIIAQGKRVSHDFLCSLSPIYVLSEKTIVPLATFVIKPVYDMLKADCTEKTIGQPLNHIKVASIPNGLLLTRNPNYMKSSPSLFFPGKDDKSKNPPKVRARVSFDELRNIDSWRVKKINVK